MVNARKINFVWGVVITRCHGSSIKTEKMDDYSYYDEDFEQDIDSGEISHKQSAKITPKAAEKELKKNKRTRKS